MFYALVVETSVSLLDALFQWGDIVSVIRQGNTYATTQYTLYTHWCNRPATYLGYPLQAVQPALSAIVKSYTRTYELTANYGLLRKRRIPVPPTSNFSYVETDDSPLTSVGFITQMGCSVYNTNQTYYRLSGTFNSVVNYPSDIITPAIMATCDSHASRKLLTRIKDQKVNVAVASAEFGKVCNMLTETATKIRKTYSYLRKGNIKRAYDELGLSLSRKQTRKYKRAHADDPRIAAENEWLAMRYGWTPLIKDIYGAAEVLADYNVPVMRNRIEASHSMTLSAETLPVNLFNGWPDWKSSSKIIAKHTTKMVCVMVPNTSAPTAVSLGITNPVALAWELIPFSFVVDWFYPIGQALNNLDASVGQVFMHGTKTRFTTHDITSLHSGENLSNITQHYSGTATSRRKKVVCSRVLLPSFPDVELPQFKSPLSVTHAIDAISLLKQTFFK